MQRIFYCIFFLSFVLSAGTDRFHAEDIEENIRSEKTFLKAYSLYTEARAGDAADRISYLSAAESFMRSVPVTDDRSLKMRALWYAAFCYFLDFREEDSEKACNELSGYIKNNYPPDSEISRKIFSGLSELVSRRIKAAELHSEIRNPHFFLQASKGKNAEEKRLFCMKMIAGAAETMLFSNSRAISQIDQAVCVENLHIIGAAFQLYIQDHNGSFPPDFNKENRQWHAYLFPYIEKNGTNWKSRSSIWMCPCVEKNAFSYGFNENLRINGINSIKKINSPEKVCLIADSVYYNKGAYPHNPSYGGPSCRIQHNLEQPWVGTIDSKRHSVGANILFVDGHVEWLSRDSISHSYDARFWSGKFN